MIFLLISYVLIVVGIIWIFASSNNMKTRLVLVPGIIWYTLAIYFGVNGMLGYPVNFPPPEGSIINAYKVVEPSGEDKGGIYLWVTPSDKIMDKSYIPRSYRIDYREQDHRQITRERGRHQFLRFMGYSSKESSVFQVVNKSSVLTKEE